jgi:HAD superfamily hydrolase (TIGR01509 family)
MMLLDGIRVACFDLFDTLIHVRSERFPETDLDGTPIRSTIPILHERVLADRGVSLRELRDAMVAVWPGIRAELERQDGSEDERYREMQAMEKYRRALRQLGRFEAPELDAIAHEIAVVHHECLVAASEPAERAGEVLEAVRARGIETVLISNWDHAPAAEEMLKFTGLSELLDHVVISEAVGLRKPHPRLFEIALEHSGATAREALHVGDLAKPDAWGAGRLGFRTVWIDKNEDGWPCDLDGTPTLTVTRLAELLDHI